jgi:hypothetical protein
VLEAIGFCNVMLVTRRRYGGADADDSLTPEEG